MLVSFIGSVLIGDPMSPFSNSSPSSKGMGVVISKGVWAAGWEEQHARTVSFDHLTRRRSLMAGKIVKDDDIARRQGRHKNLGDIGPELPGTHARKGVEIIDHDRQPCISSDSACAVLVSVPPGGAWVLPAAASAPAMPFRMRLQSPRSRPPPSVIFTEPALSGNRSTSSNSAAVRDGRLILD